MEEKQLNEKESLELITQMIRNTQQRIERGMEYHFLFGAIQPCWFRSWFGLHSSQPKIITGIYYGF